MLERFRLKERNRDWTVHPTGEQMTESSAEQLRSAWVSFSADPLSQITNRVRLSSLFCGLLRIVPPFAHAVLDDKAVHVFLVTHGQLYMGEMQGLDVSPMLIETGDLVIVAHARPYRIHYPLDVSPGVEVVPRYIDDSSKRNAADVEWLAMGCRLDTAHSDLLLDFLPPMIHLRKAGLTHWLKQTVDLFIAEHRAHSSGRGSLLCRLAEIVLVQALRLWIERMPPDSNAGLLRGLRDAQIARALQTIHQNPEFRWTVESLARQVGMSRTVFATRFKTLVDESPMQYVSRWRMHRAAGLLEGSRVSLKSLAVASGYRSAATFRTNFKRQFGRPPSEYRRRAR
jgi:AraC-like DNA-binding protein